MVAAVPQSVLAQRHAQAPCKLKLVISSVHKHAPHTDSENKWSMWVALHGFSNKHMAAIIEQVVYACRETSVTTYPPFFTWCRYGPAPTMVRCQIRWAPVLGIRPTTVDHRLMLEKSGNSTLRTIDVDRDALDTLEFEVLRRAPRNKQRQLDKKKPAKLPGVDPTALNALGLEVLQKRVEELPVLRVSPKTCMTQDASLLEVVVGNRYRALPWWNDEEPCHEWTEHCHEWTMYVLLPGFQVCKSTMIKRVAYKLHTTFSEDTYTLNSPNFELTCAGSETFRVTCTIYWNPAFGLQPTTLVHELVFDELGGRTSATVSLSSRQLKFFA